MYRPASKERKEFSNATFCAASCVVLTIETFVQNDVFQLSLFRKSLLRPHFEQCSDVEGREEERKRGSEEERKRGGEEERKREREEEQLEREEDRKG